MEDFKLKARRPQSLMPCDPCISLLTQRAAQGDLNPFVYCEHRETVAIQDGAYFHLHQCYGREQAFAIVMDVGKKSVAAWKSEATKQVLNAIDKEFDDLKRNG